MQRGLRRLLHVTDRRIHRAFLRARFEAGRLEVNSKGTNVLAGLHPQFDSCPWLWWTSSIRRVWTGQT